VPVCKYLSFIAIDTLFDSAISSLTQLSISSLTQLSISSLTQLSRTTSTNPISTITDKTWLLAGRRGRPSPRATRERSSHSNTLYPYWQVEAVAACYENVFPAIELCARFILNLILVVVYVDYDQVSGLGFRGLGFRVSGFGFRGWFSVSGLGFRVSGFGFRVNRRRFTWLSFTLLFIRRW